MSTTLAPSERVLHMEEIDQRVRHTVVLQLFAHLDPDSALQLVVDHDPKPLRYQLEARHGDRCRWIYLEEGPDTWRVRLQRTPQGACHAEQRPSSCCSRR